MKFSELVRNKKGTTHIYEFELKDRIRKSSNLQSQAQQVGAKVTISFLNAFDMKHNPVYLMRCEVIKKGDALQESGPRTNSHELRKFKYKRKLLTLQEIADQAGIKYNSLYAKIVSRKKCENGSDITKLV